MCSNAYVVFLKSTFIISEFVSLRELAAYISCVVWYVQKDNARLAHSMTVLGSSPLRTLVLYSSDGCRLVLAASSGFGNAVLHVGQIRWFDGVCTSPSSAAHSTQKTCLDDLVSAADQLWPESD